MTEVDNTGCADPLQVFIKNLDGLNIISTSTTDAGCGNSNGSIRIEVNEGTPPYSFQLDNREIQMDNNFNSISAGKHVITVKDASSCEIKQQVIIN